MEILPVTTRVLRPPQDDLFGAIRESALVLREHDCIAVTSKVVSISEGRCVPIEGDGKAQRDALAKAHCERYLERQEGFPTLHTITRGFLIGGAGIDASNANGHFMLWPKDPKKSAATLLAWLKNEYGVKNLSLIITDSHNTPLRRGAIGFALAWAGMAPLIDHRGTPDLFGRPFVTEHTNLADAYAAAAVLAMGETNECTPLAVIRNAPHRTRLGEGESDVREVPYEVPLGKDLFAPFLSAVEWKKGGAA